MKDPYTVLGAPENADRELIDSIYEASAKAFHPDVFKGDTRFAETRFNELTTAYKQIRGNAPGDGDTDTPANIDAIHSSSWDRACEFFPHLARIDRDLSAICTELSESFRSSVLSRKAFGRADEIGGRIEHDFGVDNFGSDVRFRTVGITAIKRGQTAFAFALMEARNLLGDGHFERIVSRVGVEYPDAALAILRDCGFEAVLSGNYEWVRPGLYSMGNIARLRIYPDVGVLVTSEHGRDLVPPRRFQSVVHMLVHYGQSVDRLLPIEE